MEKNRVLAIVLALFLGGLGIHRFYVGRAGSGVIYLLFCWTGIPAIVAVLEALCWLFTSNQSFQKRYNR
jgi:TM2 domain-containing membrane protein YozV